jgi:hypothetical protein
MAPAITPAMVVAAVCDDTRQWSLRRRDAIGTQRPRHIGATPRNWHARVPMSAIKDQRLGDAAFRMFCCLCGHANDETGDCRVSAATIAREVGKARPTVVEHLNTLESLGYITKHAAVRPDGGTAANRYRVARNGATEMPPHVGPADRGVSVQPTGGVSPADTQKEHTERTEEWTPPAGESRAREREGFSNDEFDGRQAVLLLPINGGGDRRALLKRYNPSAALVDWAWRKGGIDARADDVLSEFIDWYIEHIENNKLPGDMDAIEAAYRRWIRREKRYAEQSRHRPQQHSNPAEAETAAAAEFFERIRSMRANGTGH